MFCFKIGSQCSYYIEKDDQLIFVLMPFENTEEIFEAIKDSVESIDGFSFRCERADTRYSNFSIWCDRICKNIQRAKYIIADTTRKNANVFYELGFAHALENT